jgi:hypothetical protein
VTSKTQGEAQFVQNYRHLAVTFTLEELDYNMAVCSLMMGDFSSFVKGLTMVGDYTDVKELRAVIKSILGKVKLSELGLGDIEFMNDDENESEGEEEEGEKPVKKAPLVNLNPFPLLEIPVFNPRLANKINAMYNGQEGDNGLQSEKNSYF